MVRSDSNVFRVDNLRNIMSGMSTSYFAGRPGGPGCADGTGTLAQFNTIVDMTCDSSGYVWVSDSCGLRKIDTAGTVVTPFTARAGWAVTIDTSGNLYFAASYAVYQVSPNGGLQIVLVCQWIQKHQLFQVIRAAFMLEEIQMGIWMGQLPMLSLGQRKLRL